MIGEACPQNLSKSPHQSEGMMPQFMRLLTKCSPYESFLPGRASSGDAIDINAAGGATVTCRTERWYEDMTLDSPIVCGLGPNKASEVTLEDDRG